MGVTVSQEWKDNQKAIVRRPGFVNIKTPSWWFPGDSIPYRVEKEGDGIVYITEKTGLVYYDDYKIVMIFDKDVCAGMSPTPHVRVESYNSKDELLRKYTFTYYSAYPDDVERTVRDPDVSYVKIIPYSGSNIIKDIDIIKDIVSNTRFIKSADIINVEHSRSYDPMGFELPTNNISVDVLNYDDKYTEFYKSYSNNPYQIDIKYGYNLESGDEVIDGGSFTMTDVQLSDDVLTITGDNLLSQIDDKLQVNIFDLKGENGYIRIPVSDDASIETVGLSNREELSITSGDILNYLRYKCGINIIWSPEVNLSAQIVNTAINASYKELLQAIVNLTLDRCYVDRYDVLAYGDSNHKLSDGEDILMMNCFEKPSYSSTKKIKSFEITDYALGNTQIAEEKTTGHSESGDSTGRVKLDTLSIKLLSVDVSWFSNIDGIYYLDIYPDNVSVRYHHNSHEERERGMRVEYASFDESVIVSNVGSQGAICDINSPLGTPANLDKIVKYFSNRDLYTFKVRGNPARDVGDYINVSLTDDNDPSTYKKGLVLSSTLSYNGSFKEEVTVRIIENEFEGETDNGNNV